MGDLPGMLQSPGTALNAVKVGTEAHVLFTAQLAYMVDMIGHGVHIGFPS